MFKFLQKIIKVRKEKSILDDDRFKPEIEDINLLPIDDEGKINYMRLPFSPSSKLAFSLSLLALLLSYLAIRISIFLKGNPELYVSAIIFSSLIFAFYSLYCVYRSFKEKEVKHILAYISLFLSGIQIILWFIIIIIGGRK